MGNNGADSRGLEVSSAIVVHNPHPSNTRSNRHSTLGLDTTTVWISTNPSRPLSLTRGWFIPYFSPLGLRPKEINVKRTFQPNNRRRAKTHGFRLRMRTRAGRAVLSARRRKGRARLAV